MDNDLVSKRRAERCTTHHHACDCREYAHAQEITRKDAEIAELRTRAERAEGRIADAPTAEVTLGCYLDAGQLPPEFALRRVALVVLND